MTRKRIFSILVMLVAVCCVCGSLQGRVGVGIELLDRLPLVIGNLGWNNLGFVAGIGLVPTGEIEQIVEQAFGSDIDMSPVIVYSATARYFLPLPILDSAIRPYLGGGIIGGYCRMLAWGISASMVGLGLELLGGLEVNFASYGIPLAIHGGATWVYVDKAVVSVMGESESFPVELGGFLGHLGFQWFF